MQTTTLNVEGMSCNHCVKAVEGAVQEAGAQGTVDLGAKTVDVSYDEATVSLDAIKAAIEDQGYDIV